MKILMVQMALTIATKYLLIFLRKLGFAHRLSAALRTDIESSICCSSIGLT